MAVRPIVISGDPVLHMPAAPVVDFDDELRTLVQDMFETMDAAPGVGLAGPQVGVPLRLFTFSYVDDDERAWRGAAINPELWITPVPAGDADGDRGDPQFRVDGRAAPRPLVVIDVAEREEPKRDADLRAGQADAGGGIHRLEHVLDERAQLVVEIDDESRGRVEHGIT